MTTSLTRGLVRLLARPVDPDTRSRAALHVLDWLGCAAIGAAEPVGRLLLDWTARAPAGEFTTIGGNAVATPEMAIRCNGGLGNVFEMDDIHKRAILHPGPVVLPAALAAAQEVDASADAFLAAVVRGYDAQIRLGTAVGPGHYANWHNTSTCGPFGAAASTGSLLELDEEESVWAFGNAATQASGPWRCRHEHVMTKQLHTARAAESGYLAASLAASGFTGPERILEGEQGFFQAMCPDPLPDRVLSDREGPWKIWETSFKPWPACRHAHAAIDAALEIRGRLAAEPASIARIRIRTYSDATQFCDRQHPTTTLEAKFSLQHCVAAALRNGEPELDDFAPEAVAAAEVVRLRDCTSVSVDAVFDSRYPARYGSGVDVVLRDGSVLTADISDALGDPENPLSEEQVVSKAESLMAAAGIPEQAAARVTDATLELSGTSDFGRFSACLADLKPEAGARRAA